jgi:hypothetical protein
MSEATMTATKPHSRIEVNVGNLRGFITRSDQYRFDFYAEDQDCVIFFEDERVFDRSSLELAKNTTETLARIDPTATTYWLVFSRDEFKQALMSVKGRPTPPVIP